MSTTAVLGIAATLVGVAMGLSPLLQVRTILERRSSDDVSVPFFAVLIVGLALWLSYGIALGNPALIISNAVGLTSYIFAILAVIRFKGRKFRSAPRPGV
jgi:MtN3 and saliva related transmembrane protein